MAGDGTNTVQHRTLTFDYDFRSLNTYETFENASPWQGQLRSWQCTLGAGRLRAIADSFRDAAEADRSLSHLLRAWECVAYLQHKYDVTFIKDSVGREAGVTEGADEVDRIFRCSYATYPEPDENFEMTADVVRLMGAIDAFRRKAVRLLDAMKELVAVVDKSGASDELEAAALRYSIDRDVLSAIEKLVRRDTDSANQSAAKQTYRGPEWQWMQEALRLVTLQVGRGASQPPQNHLSLADFKTQL